MKLALAAAVLSLATAMPAAAATYTFNGTTEGGPTYNRVIEAGNNRPSTLSNTGTSVNYQAFTFNVGTSGNYSLGIASGFDNFLTLYSGSFDAASPLTNALIADDDDGELSNAFLSSNLLTGTSYVAVVTSFSNRVSGVYTLTIDGPGAINPGAVPPVAAVPEPATWGMMLVGFGMIGFGMRRRKSDVRTSVRFA